MSSNGHLVQLLNDVFVRTGVSVKKYSILRIINTIQKDINGLIEFYYELSYINETFTINTNEVRYLTIEEHTLYNSNFMLMEDVDLIAFNLSEMRTLSKTTVYQIDTFLPYKIGVFIPAIYYDDYDTHYIAPLSKSIHHSTIINIKETICNLQINN